MGKWNGWKRGTPDFHTLSLQGVFMRGYSLPLFPSTIVYISHFHLFHLIFIM